MLRNSVVFNVAGMLRGLKVPSRISFLCLSQCFLTPNFSTADAASLTPAPIWEMQGHESCLWLCCIPYWIDQWKIKWMEVARGRGILKVPAGGDALALLHQFLTRDPGLSKIWSSLTCSLLGSYPPVDCQAVFCSKGHRERLRRKLCYYLPISSMQTLSELADCSFSNLAELY